MVDIHSKVTKLDLRPIGRHLVPKCSNRAMVICNLVRILVNPLSTHKHHMAVILVHKLQVDMPLAGTSRQLHRLSKPHREVVVMITTTSNKLHKPKHLVVPLAQPMPLPMVTISKVKVMVKMGMVDTHLHLNLVMCSHRRDMINKVMVIRHLDIILKPPMAKLLHMEVRLIMLLTKLLHRHLHLNLVTFSNLKVLLSQGMGCLQRPSQAMGLSRLLDMVVMDPLRLRNLLLHQLLMGSSSRHSSLLMLLHKVGMLNQLRILVDMLSQMVVVSDLHPLLMVVVDMPKHHMVPQLLVGMVDSRRHMEALMGVAIPSNLLLHILVMRRLLQQLKVVSLVVVRLLKLRLSRVDGMAGSWWFKQASDGLCSFK